MGFNISSYIVFIERIDWSKDPRLSQRLGYLTNAKLQNIFTIYRQFMYDNMDIDRRDDILDVESRNFSEVLLQSSKLTPNVYGIFWILGEVNPGKFVHNLFKVQSQITIDDDCDADMGPYGQFKFSNSLSDELREDDYIDPEYLKPYLRKEIAFTEHDIRNVMMRDNANFATSYEWAISYDNMIPPNFYNDMVKYIAAKTIKGSTCSDLS